MLSGATDVAGLVRLCESLPNTEIRFIPNLHAKVYIADERCAVVTSANLTHRGLSKNLEYGFWVSEPAMVKQVRHDIMEYGAIASRIDVPQLRMFDRVIEDLRDITAKVEKSARAQLRREFARRLVAADEQILRARAEGLSPHAAFADTILFVLRTGARDTTSIYSEIQRIHPDLCDDSITLVIKGEVWSQVKWHHRVRHAQLFLKRQGKIRRKGNKWHLVV